MCTVSVVPHADGIRMMSNRDERRTRGVARPPSWWRVGPRRALFPIDADAGGTWIGVNDAGLAVALLNRTTAADARPCSPSLSSVSPPAVAPRSRGAIVPQLLTAARIDDVLLAARRIRRAQYRPFRALAVCDGVALIISAGPEDFRDVCLRLDAPLLLTSSSLGDEYVDPPRRDLFAALMSAPGADWRAAQQRFHAHQSPSTPHLGVVMARRDARTVSRTTCDVSRDGRVHMVYEALEDTAAVRLAS